MAGPKVGAKPKGKGEGRTGRPLKAEGAKHNALSIRGATEGRDWLTRLSDHCRLKTADPLRLRARGVFEALTVAPARFSREPPACGCHPA